MKLSLCLVAAIAALIPIHAVGEKPASVCKVTFQVVYLDRLNNYNIGIPPGSLKDIEKRLKKLGDVCYAGGADTKGDVVFFIHTTPATYHGAHVYTNSSSAAAAATNSDGSGAASAATTTSTTAVTYSVDYSTFILDIEKPKDPSSFTILHTLDQKGLYNTITASAMARESIPSQTSLKLQPNGCTRAI